MKNLDLLIPQKQIEEGRFTWATVTSTDPVRVRLDGETAPLDITPDTLVSFEALEVNRRVWCQVYGRRILLLGQVGGSEAEVDRITFPIADGWITSEAVDGWTLRGDGSTAVREPVADEEITNKGYVDAAVSTSQLTDFGRYWRTSSFSTPNAWGDFPSPTGTESSGGVAWDGTYNGFVISKPGVYVLSAGLEWNTFGTSFRRYLILRREESDGSGGYEAVRSADESAGRVANVCSSIEVVTQADLDTTGVRFKGRIYQNTGGSTTPDGPLRMQVARLG